MLGVLNAIKDATSASGPFKPRKVVFQIEGGGSKTFPHMFNPVDYKIGRKVTWQCESGDAKNGGTPYYAFSAGQDTLSFSVVLDCSEEFAVDLLPEVQALYDLTVPYTTDTDQASGIRAQTVTIHWGKFKFTGVVESVDITVNLFDPDGRMKRATATLAMKGNAFKFVDPKVFFNKGAADKAETPKPADAAYKKPPLDKSKDFEELSEPSKVAGYLAKVGI